MSKNVLASSEQHRHVVINVAPDQEEVQANRGSCPKPRDWSEWVILPTAVFSLSAGIVGAVSDVVDPQNNGEFFTVSCFAISGVLGLAWVRVRQLWVKKSLDEETRRFQGENRDLTGRVTELEGLLEQRDGVISKLQSDVERFQQEDGKLAEQTDRLASETDGLQRVVKALPDHLRQLDAESLELASRVDQIQTKPVDEEKQRKKSGSHLDEIEMTLASLQQQSDLEKARHQQAMKSSEHL